MYLLIATTKTPTAENYESFCQLITEAGTESGLVAFVYGLYDGPGCANLVIHVETEDSDAILRAEQFAKELTIALMPAKWTTTMISDEIPGYHLTV